MTSASIRLSLRKAFKGGRKRTEGVTEARRGHLKMGSFFTRPHLMRPGTGRSHPTTCVVRSNDHMITELVLQRSRMWAKASKRGKKSFVGQLRSSIKKDTTALRFPISCGRLA